MYMYICTCIYIVQFEMYYVCNLRYGNMNIIMYLNYTTFYPLDLLSLSLSLSQIQWFWRALRSFDQADRAGFIQFVTGTSKVPLQGFASLEGMNGVQKFQIHRDDRSTERLPCAHTW